MKAKTITEIHTEAERTLGLRKGRTANIKSGRAAAPGNRPNFGDMMPRMPGARRMHGMQELGNAKWEVLLRSKSMPKENQNQFTRTNRSSFNPMLLPRENGSLYGKTSALLQSTGKLQTRSTTIASSSKITQQYKPRSYSIKLESAVVPSDSAVPKFKIATLQKKIDSLLEEYFCVRDLNEARQCVEELNAPDFHTRIVKEAMNLALEKNPPCIEPLVKLLEFFYAMKVITSTDIASGFVLYASMLDDIGIDLPTAPGNFGIVIGKQICCSAFGLKLVKDVLRKVEDSMYRRAVFDNMMKTIKASVSGEKILDGEVEEVKAFEILFA